MGHAERKHALLSASGASKWLNCTPSARLEDQFESETSVYAEEGTLAHEFGELYLRKEFTTGLNIDTELKALRENELYAPGMEEYVQQYVDYVVEQYRIHKSAMLFIEHKIDLTYYIEEGFGTGDSIIIADRILEIVDLKYGKGVSVSADDNSQLKLYAIGALRAFDLLYEIDAVKLTIVQPRKDSVSSYTLTAAELQEWGETVVKQKAMQAFKGEGIQVPGDWCRWCKAKTKCKALADKNTELAKLDFAEPMLLTDDELLQAYKVAEGLQDWLNSVSAYILQSAINGKKWPGFKLVEGRSVRFWSDEAKVVEKLKAEGFKEDQLFTKKLLGIPPIEKLVGKEKFSKALGNLVVKPEGKPTLAPEADKRKEISSISDFI